MNNKISENILKRTSEHIIYEIEMLRFAVSILRKPNLPQLMINSFLEVFAIHVRNLYYFFYTGIKNRKKDDVIVEDFILNKKLFKSQRTPKEKLKIITKKTAKQVAHLTYYRIRYNKRTKPWKFYDIYLKLEKTINAFKLALPDSRGEWFKI